MKEEGAWWAFLRGGKDVNREECTTALLRSPYKPSTSEPVTATSIFSNPSVSRCWASLCSLSASLHRKLACFSNFSPYKIKNKRGKQGVALQKVTWRYKSERYIKFTSISSPHAPSSGWAGKPPTCTQLHRVSMSLPSSVHHLGASSSAESSDRKKRVGMGRTGFK